ncbi:MAG: AarF/UbiB family protein [Desulfobacterales bacterium]|jgi:3-deoxy-D-manno-octulosonic acid kinase|nr:AarF/UbiB family protein [Desulfobacterales bacterium]
MKKLQYFQSYRFGSDVFLSEKQLSQIVSCFYEPLRNVGLNLGGRTAVCAMELSGVGPVVVKRYTRGGVIRRFIKKTYIRIGKTRGQSEYELLQELNRMGVHAPDPVAFAFKGSIFYQAWIITREIKDTQTLSALSFSNPVQTRLAMTQLRDQVQRLIDNQIHHVDLHPGNVLVDRSGSIHIIDFDKAKTVALPGEQLKTRYIRRWQRAVDKHHLPKMIRGLF